MCRVTRFCCCCDLKTGAIIVAIFTVIVVVLCTAATILSFTHGDQEDQLRQTAARLGYDQQYGKASLWVIRAMWITISVTGCLVALCLCCALSNNRAICVMPWLIWEMIAIILVIIGAILFFVRKQWWEGVLQLVGLPFAVYIWICIYSYYLELKGALHITRGV